MSDPDPKELRKRAAQARRATNIATNGGQAADRQLIALATRLEREAEEREHTQKPSVVPTGKSAPPKRVASKPTGVKPISPRKPL